MRVPAAALALLLLVAICSPAQADLRVSRNLCCPRTISRPFPRRAILSVYRTSSSCPIEAVVLVTRKGLNVCADPKAHWVQKYLEDFEFVDF
uniref:Chemokine interleukin-8-like domain-containing protein n=1 Tax=Cyanoderma ruficeps TaxID=181631 RepID=A0A8C3QKJ4_9PASS